MEITKEELVSLIKDTVLSLNSCAKEEEEVKNEEATIQEAVEAEEEKVEKEEEKTEVAEEPVANEETKVEEPIVEEEKTEEPVVEEEKEEEVIKEEVLNSAPVIGTDISGKSDWQNLKGQAFFDWLKKNKNNI